MNLKTDLEDKTVSFSLPASLYSLEGVQIAAHVYASRAEVYLDQGPAELEVTLKSHRPRPARAELEALGGDFLNELLNQEYRFIVGRFNQKISNLIVTQALFSARGGENPPQPPEEESTPEFAAEVARMMREAQEAIDRTMPKKIPPQGSPLPPAPEEIGA